METNIPTLGASFNITEFSPHRDWIVASNRDLELYSLAGFLKPDADMKEEFKDLPQMLDGYTGRMGLHGPIQASFATYDRDLRKAILKQFTDALELCEHIGATHMVIHSPFISLGAPFPAQFMKMMIIDPAVSILGELVPIAEKIKCTLMIENVFDTHPDFLLKLVESANSEYVRMSLDVGHAYVMHKWGGAPTPDYWIREAGSLLGHLHLQDTDGYTDRHWPPGEGYVPWYAIFEALGTLEHNPRLILEVSSQGVKPGVQYLTSKGYVR